MNNLRASANFFSAQYGQQHGRNHPARVRPQVARDPHQKFDRAVLDAYGWPYDISDEEILSRLLALNVERAN